MSHGKIHNPIESEVIRNEKNLSAQEKAEKSWTRLQKENEHGKRQKSFEAQTSERQSQTDLLIVRRLFKEQ